jgi:hypothetical protein
MATWTLNPGSSLQTLINNAGVVNGDTIELAPGTHNSDTVLTISKQLTIKAAVAGSYPNLKLFQNNFSPPLFTFQTSNITIEGLEIDNTRATTNNCYFSNVTTAITNLTITKCKLHHFRRQEQGGTSNGVDGFTFTHNEVYSFEHTGLEFSNIKNATITHNKIYNQQNITSNGQAGITWFARADVGTSVIAYNYIWGVRYGISIQPGVLSSVSTGTIDIHHNTIDVGLGVVTNSVLPTTILNYSRSGSTVTVNTTSPHGLVTGNYIIMANTGTAGSNNIDSFIGGVAITSTPTTSQFTITAGSGTYSNVVPINTARIMKIDITHQPQRWATSFYTLGTNKLNGANIKFRDNLISRSLGAMYIAGNNVFTSEMVFENNLFFDTNALHWPVMSGSSPIIGIRYQFETFEHVNGKRRRPIPSTQDMTKARNRLNVAGKGSKPIASYSNFTDKYWMTFKNNFHGNPLYAMNGVTPETFYVLLDGSPAKGTATDGTNIGAWQGP